MTWPLHQLQKLWATVPHVICPTIVHKMILPCRDIGKYCTLDHICHVVHPEGCNHIIWNPEKCVIEFPAFLISLVQNNQYFIKCCEMLFYHMNQLISVALNRTIMFRWYMKKQEDGKAIKWMSRKSMVWHLWRIEKDREKVREKGSEGETSWLLPSLMNHGHIRPENVTNTEIVTVAELERCKIPQKTLTSGRRCFVRLELRWISSS